MTLERADFATLKQLPSGARPDEEIQIDGWIAPFEPAMAASYFALVSKAACCVGCLPNDARSRIEVFAAVPIAITGERVRLAGRLHALPDDDPSGWKFQLHDARVLSRQRAPDARFTRRNALRTSAAAPGPRSRLIAPDHARAIASTGGVIGIWPPASIFPDLPALAVGVARMSDVVGVEHVALGSDMNGLVGPSTFASYRDLPALADALFQHGFNADDVRRILGGNYARVFRASLGALPSQAGSSAGATQSESVRP